MIGKLIILADLGRLKAYRVSRDALTGNSKLELIENLDLAEAHGRMLDKVSDKAGRFPVSAGSGGMSIGENHNFALEQQRRLVRQLGDVINDVVKRENTPYW